jgi:nucleoside-diphosphate-sugar epimerase
MKRALVCGAGGFIGSHLVKKLKREGYWVRGVDLKKPEHWKTEADDFMIVDLRKPYDCKIALTFFKSRGENFDEVYQLAADMGGMGFIHSAECEIMTNNVLINVNMINAAARAGVKRYFYSSSACIYREQAIGEDPLSEEDAYPAMPDNEYGWEKLYSERMAEAFGRNTEMLVSIARFQNCYGPYGTWRGGREKAPAALSRKIAETEDGTIDVWGDGTAVRNFIYVNDMVDAIYMLTQSEIREPINIGTDELITVNGLVEMLSNIAGKDITVNHVDGPVGVLGRYETFDKITAIGWKPKYSMLEGMEQTFKWIEEQYGR